jgi:hypothetical protein
VEVFAVPSDWPLRALSANMLTTSDILATLARMAWGGRVRVPCRSRALAAARRGQGPLEFWRRIWRGWSFFVYLFVYLFVGTEGRLPLVSLVSFAIYVHDGTVFWYFSIENKRLQYLPCIGLIWVCRPWLINQSINQSINDTFFSIFQSVTWKLLLKSFYKNECPGGRLESINGMDQSNIVMNAFVLWNLVDVSCMFLLCNDCCEVHTIFLLQYVHCLCRVQ